MFRVAYLFSKKKLMYFTKKRIKEDRFKPFAALNVGTAPNCIFELF